MISLMMALAASERREVVIEEGDASLNLPASFAAAPAVMDGPFLNQAGKTSARFAEALDKATAAIEASKAAYEAVPWDANWKPTRGRVVSEAKGPNRAQRRGQ